MIERMKEERIGLRSELNNGMKEGMFGE